ncbi:MAG TPA: bifunctional YncE family protein/alkaline phosphatase family protein [Acidimicrobiales bacterium]|nr:bifunctional YncE family protein/alkaline phosphatase family protein [Acidimicrobiales bacterium]
MVTRRSPIVPLLVVLGLLVGGAGGIAVVSRTLKKVEPLAYEGNARRFLDLTQADGRAAGRGAPSLAMAGDRDGPGGGDFTPAGARVRPPGQQIPVFNFPLGLTATAGNDTVLVSSDNGGMQGITQINAGTGRPTHYPAANLFMGMTMTPGGKLYASGGNADRVFRYSLTEGVLVPHDVTEAATVPLHHLLDAVLSQVPDSPALPVTDGIRVHGYPGNSVLDGRYLYVAGTLSEPTGAGADACPGGRPACARVSVIDTTTDTVVGRAPVGLDAYGLALDAPRHRLFVSNWADEAGRGDGVGSISTVNIADPLHPVEQAWVKVGHHPTAMQVSADHQRLFVANTNDDSITVLDVSGATPTVVGTESVRPLAGVPVGAYPNAFALSPNGDTLFVALAGLNAVEIRDGHTGARLSGAPKYIPTGWYPSALTITGDAAHYKLWVANAKGAGASTKSTGLNLSIGHEITPLDGTVSAINLPVSLPQETAWTEQVEDNNHLSRVDIDPCQPGNGIRVSQVLCPPDGKQRVKHVVYIVTENKTFDQYFGDLDPTRYDSDLKYVLYGKPVTPNHHALAERYSLSDRFFSDAQVSVTGHSWTSGAIATDHNEKTFEADYDEGIRGTHGNGDPLKPGIGGAPGKEIGEAEDELDDPEGGYIFEAFKRAGAVPPAQAAPNKLSMAIYGESTARESGDMSAYNAPSWGGDIQYFDTCRAQLFTTGKTVDGLIVPDDAPEQIQDCGTRTMTPQFNLAHWAQVMKDTGKDVMPNFIYMTLPVNHTLGTNLFNVAPASMVADNDNAIGMIADALSKSPFWESTVIMQTEDDTQAAGDHISPLRDYLQVSGPWAQPGPNHQWGSMPSLLRTIEHIFKVDPITLHDRLAFPQHGAFRATIAEGPDLTPYDLVPELIPFAINQLGAPGQAESMAMDWTTVDRIDMGLLNAILYAVARGTPFVAPSR